MTERDWNVHHARAIGIYMNGDGIQSVDARGGRVVDDSFYMIVSAHDGTLAFKLPEEVDHGEWRVAVSTEDPTLEGSETVYRVGDVIRVGPRSVLVLWAAQGLPPVA